MIRELRRSARNAVRVFVEAATLTLLALSCARMLLSPSDLVGRYRLDYPFGAVELELDSSGKYTQTISIRGAHGPTVNQGKWWLNASRHRVNFTDWIEVTNLDGKLRSNYAAAPKVACTMPVYGTGARDVSFDVDPDYGLRFHKIP